MGKISSTAGEGNIIPRIKTVINVNFNPLKDKINYNIKCLTEIDRWYSDKYPVPPKFGVKKYHSIIDMIDMLNNLKGDYQKDGTPAILKGIFKNGTGGVFCIQGAYYLFYDIDVKNTLEKKENVHLFDAKLNSDVFDYMQSISVFTARSNSGLGIFGVLYVPGLGNYLQDKKDEHKLVGDQIISELSKKILKDIGIKVLFDSSQNAFRQIRNTAVQSSKIELNQKHIQVDFTVTYEEEKTISGVPKYKYTDHTGYLGSIKYQYNQNNKIEDTLLSCNFKKTSQGRYHHPSTTSSSTGQVNFDDNNFYSHSESFGKRLFTPFDLYMYVHGLSYGEFIRQLKRKGYSYIPAESSEIDLAIDRLNHEHLGTQDIFEICDPLKGLPINQRYDLIDMLDVDPLTSMHVHSYLQIPELTIKYDYEIQIKDYLGNDFNKLLPIIDTYQRVCVYAGTGYGKTSGFVEHFKKQENIRVIILAPLQIIVNQVSNKYKIPCLTGSSKPDLHSKAKRASIFVATYEQGIKHLASEQYDYIIVDEFHNLITANSYKQEVLSELYQSLENTKSKVIGLTGTPSNIMRKLGYKIVKVAKDKTEAMRVIERLTNRRGHFIVINHVLAHRGKSIFRLNSTNDLKSIKEELVKNHGYKDSQILVFYSSKAIKESKAYKLLVEEGRFPKEIQIVLTTAMIDEGININQSDFENIVFIESNDYYPRPEPIKQFFARVRKPGVNTKYYLYRKYVSKAEQIYFNEFDYFDAASKSLIEDRNEMNDYNTYMDLLNNNEYYFESSGDINKANLAYYTSRTAVNNFTTHMLDRYLTNYDIDIVRDKDFKEKVLDPTFKKTWDIEVKSAIRHVWVNERDTVYSVIKYESQDPDLRILLEDKNTSWNDEYIEFIYQYIKDFEKYLTYQLRFETLGVNPDKHIVGTKKLCSIEKLNNELFILESMAVINNPKNNADIRAKKRLEFIKDQLIDKGTFSKKDIEEAFSLYPVIKKPSIAVVKKFLELFVVVTYNKQTKTYRVKQKR